MKVICLICKLELKEKGAVYLSPPIEPEQDNIDIVCKFHICQTCHFDKVAKFFEQYREIKK